VIVLTNAGYNVDKEPLEEAISEKIVYETRQY
jgi:hypothetical protein